ncbi:nitrite reductase large subunit NirB [Brevibacillus migulae]|uniref:nitrite reductase large subunit NirB n=1 Tax=Brevibacillus migulae TaxID=1644114 RepID=UPI00106EECBF|nr:nitrite reductase large subunit NirB [Brevibacillus migulae]
MKTQPERQKLVLVGNGMAGIHAIEQLLTYTQRYDITVFGNEPFPNYNRIQLSYVLEGSKSIDEIILNPREWYAANGITLYTDTTVTRIDTVRQRAITANGMDVPYDKVIIATGSKPYVLPIPGADLAGVVGFRDIRDCEQMISAAQSVRQAAVIGGGLLGLEAAKGLVSLGMQVTVVHLSDTLMEKQLDPTAGAMLRKELESQGIRFLMNACTVELYGENHVAGLRFSDGSELAAQLVVMAAGIRPNIEVAAASGLTVNRGIVVDDDLRTSAPNVYAIGECVEHRGECYGLVAPLFEQGAVLAKHLAGLETSPYEGSTVSTKLKISGVDVFSAGEFMESAEHRVLRIHDDWKQTYKKILLKGNRIVGGILFGDVEVAPQLTKWVNQQAEMTAEIHERLFGGGCCGGGKKTSAVEEMEDDEIVCGCNGVTKGTIVNVIRERGFTTVEEIKACTGATRSCGGCKPLVEQILQAVLGDEFTETAAQKQGICGCTPLSREEIVAAIKEKHLTHVREVMHVLEWTQQEGCSKCRPAINYYLGMMWPTEHEDERESRFVNERLHANIQKDGTFGVIPRMYGGVTTPSELRKIADVSEKYDVKLVKVTGGQRLDLLGVKKEDLPKIWAELDMPSGYGYAKSLRTVKTCVGSRFCRFGTQDSIGMGITLEQKFERISMPAKFKMAVNGCPRNCAESCTKDLGVVGNDGGWEIYVGGNGGIKARMADLLCKVKTEEELMEIAGAFIQLYRENGKYGERTSEWVERTGVEAIRRAVVEDHANRQALNERVELAIAQMSDPWKEVLHNQELRESLYEAIQKPQA